MLFAWSLNPARSPSPPVWPVGEAPLVLLVGSFRSRTAFRRLLEPAGYALIEAVDDSEALRLARKHRPHLVLLELEMPGRDGWAICRQLKSSSETFLIPVVATALDRLPAGTYPRARSAGFVDFLGLPIERRHVLEVVATWARTAVGAAV